MKFRYMEAEAVQVVAPAVVMVGEVGFLLDQVREAEVAAETEVVETMAAVAAGEDILEDTQV
ncbi:MAG: hypothetical protein ACO1NU_05760 [Arcticibacter sp.]